MIVFHAIFFVFSNFLLARPNDLLILIFDFIKIKARANHVWGLVLIYLHTRNASIEAIISGFSIRPSRRSQALISALISLVLIWRFQEFVWLQIGTGRIALLLLTMSCAVSPVRLGFGRNFVPVPFIAIEFYFEFFTEFEKKIPQIAIIRVAFEIELTHIVQKLLEFDRKVFTKFRAFGFLFKFPDSLSFIIIVYILHILPWQDPFEKKQKHIAKTFEVILAA